MGRRRCSFSAVGAPRLFFNAGDTGLAPSTSDHRIPAPASSPSRCWSGDGRKAAAAETWVWVLPASSSATEPASTACGSAAASSSSRFPWRNASTGGDSAGVSGDGRLDHGQWQWWATEQRQPQSHALTPRRLPCGVSSCDGSGGGSSRMLLLASLTTSAVATASRTSASAGSGSGNGAGVAGAGGGGGGGAPRHGFHLPQLSIMRLPGSPSFAEEQDLAQELLDYHTAKHGGFPRPCPRCKSHDFMVRRPDSTEPNPAGAAATTTAAGATSGANSAPATRAGGGRGAATASGGVVEWRSRPLRCETCGCWVHLGCAEVELAEQIPPRPWFHCRACRDTYLRLEAAAQRNPHPSSASGTHALYLLTPADHAAAGGLPRAAADGAAAAAAAAAAVTPFGGRGPAGAVVPLLLQGFNGDAVAGFGQPAREYDGGKYSAVLLSRGSPVAAATFNVYGPDAQLCLLATAVQHRLKGNGSALVADLETTLAALGVSRLLVQARGVALPLWLGRLGYELVAPEEAAELHARLPIAYYDCAVLQKRLAPPQPKQRQQGTEKQEATLVVAGPRR